jgi:hypothetical protein
MIIGSSFVFSNWPTAVDPGGAVESIYGTPQLGFWKRHYPYYFADNVPGLIGATPDSSSVDTVFSFSQNVANNFSLMWTGYLQAPATGAYKFKTVSDDCSYFWIGTDSITNVGISNADVNNGGLHGTTGVESVTPVQLTGGLYYPIRAMFGEQGGAETFYMEWNYNNTSWVPFNMDYARHNADNTFDGY